MMERWDVFVQPAFWANASLLRRGKECDSIDEHPEPSFKLTHYKHCPKLEILSYPVIFSKSDGL